MTFFLANRPYKKHDTHNQKSLNQEAYQFSAFFLDQHTFCS